MEYDLLPKTLHLRETTNKRLWEEFHFKFDDVVLLRGCFEALTVGHLSQMHSSAVNKRKESRPVVFHKMTELWA